MTHFSPVDDTVVGVELESIAVCRYDVRCVVSATFSKTIQQVIAIRGVLRMTYEDVV